jgi:hypothetical protein
MTSVLLETKTQELKSAITVTVSADHLTLNNMVSTMAESSQQAPQRHIASATDDTNSEMLTIYAFTPKAAARTVLATNPIADDYFVQGEDALFVSSGVENTTSVKSPLNMYTVAEQVPMMADVRKGISRIPLSILADNKVRTDHMQLAFVFTSNWTRTCYLVDSFTGQKTRIMNGLMISVEMPQNHEPRYYIEGPDVYNASGNEGGTTTSTDQVEVAPSAHKVWAYAPERGHIVVSAIDVMKSVTVYDITGRTMATLQPDLLSTQLTVQTIGQAGVYIVAVTFRDNTTAQTQVIVP